MKGLLRFACILAIILSLLACGRRNGASQNTPLQQTQAAATLQALVNQGGQQPAVGQEPSGGQQPPAGQQPSGGQQPPEEGGQQPVVPHPSGDQADVVIGKIELSDTSPQTNQTIQVKVTIGNHGPAAARNFQWGVIPTYSAGGPNNPVGGENITLLNPGVSKVYAVDIIYPSAGTYALMAVADLNNTLNDPDPSNNRNDINVTVSSGAAVAPNQKPKADLKITNVTASNLTPTVNEDVKISATVFNAGPDVVKNLTWAIYYMYAENAAFQPVERGTLAQLNPNDDAFISARVKYTEAGTYKVKVIADAENKVDDPFQGGGEITIKVGSVGVVAPPFDESPPAPTGCRSEAISSRVVRVFFEAPQAEAGAIDGYKIYFNDEAITILHCCAFDVMALQPNTHYYFSVVTFKGSLESDPIQCNTWIVTPP